MPNPIQAVITTGDGVRLETRGWVADEPSKGSVCIIHGLGEHIGRYAYVADRLNSAGYSVYGFDLRGHGLSTGRRGHTPSYEALMGDIDAFLEWVRRATGDRHIFLYGHSMGGNLVLGYELLRHPRVSGVIATGPWLRLAVEPQGYKLVLARLMNAIWPAMTQSNGLEGDDMSTQNAVSEAYDSDTLNHDRISARLYNEISRFGIKILDRADEFRAPLLLMHGAEDRVTSPDASGVFAGKAGAACTFRIWNGMKHELHNETNRDDVLQVIIDWLGEH